MCKNHLWEQNYNWDWNYAQVLGLKKDTCKNLCRNHVSCPSQLSCNHDDLFQNFNTVDLISFLSSKGIYFLFCLNQPFVSSLILLCGYSNFNHGFHLMLHMEIQVCKSKAQVASMKHKTQHDHLYLIWHSHQCLGHNQSELSVPCNILVYQCRGALI